MTHERTLNQSILQRLSHPRLLSRRIMDRFCNIRKNKLCHSIINILKLLCRTGMGRSFLRTWTPQVKPGIMSSGVCRPVGHVIYETEILNRWDAGEEQRDIYQDV